MQRVLIITLAVTLGLHGLIHLMGTTVYMKLGKIDGIPYKTTLMGGRWELGERGMWLIGALWVVPAAGFVISGVALGLGWAWWQPLVLGTALLSFGLTVLDWGVAYIGVIVNVIILASVLFGPRVISFFG